MRTHNRRVLVVGTMKSQTASELLAGRRFSRSGKRGRQAPATETASVPIENPAGVFLRDASLARSRRPQWRFIQSGRIVSGGGNGFPKRKPAHSTQSFVQLAEPDFSENSEMRLKRSAGRRNAQGPNCLHKQAGATAASVSLGQSRPLLVRRSGLSA